MSTSDPKARPIPGKRPPAPESAAMPPSSWAKKTGFRPKFSGETNGSDSGQISLPPRPKEQRDAQPDLEAGRVKATPPQPLPVPPLPAVNGADTAAAFPAENKDQTVVKRRRDSDGGSGGAKKDGSGHGANGAGTNGPPSGPRRAAARNEEVIDVEDGGFAGGRHTHMKYELRDTPGLVPIGLYGFQHYLSMLGSLILIPLVVVPAMGGTYEDTSTVVSTVLFVSGVTTLLHTSFGSRLPLIQGPSFVYLAPALAIINSPEFQGLNGNNFKHIMKELQGAIIIASAFQTILGYSGLMSVLLRLINPVVVAPTIAAVGLSFYSYGFPRVGTCLEIGVVQILLVIMFSLYLRKISVFGHRIFLIYAVPLGLAITWAAAFLLTEAGVYSYKGCDANVPASNIISDHCRKHVSRIKHCRVDTSHALKSSPWFRFPYPLQWGTPVFEWKMALVMCAVSIISSVDSVGSYHASSLLAASRPPTPGVVSRGIGLEGLCSVLAGLWGTGTGSTTITENVHTIAVTKMGSRRAVELGACALILLSLIGKVGGFIATATGNLGRHLSNRHPGYDKSGDSVTSSAPQPITVVKKAQQQGKQQMDYDHLNWLLVKWLILASLPPSTLEEKWLANSFKFLNPSIQLWPGERYKVKIREVFRSMQEDVMATLEKVSSKVSIILDFWSSYEQIFYMSVTCQWIDENWSFQQVLLDICQIPYPCGGSEIYHSLEKVLKMYNIESRVLSCTHDNSQNAVHACHTLKEELDGQKLGMFCYIPCAARTLNLIIEDGLRATKPVISKVREFVLELNSSAKMSEDFIQLTATYQEGSWKFPLETSARWSGNYQMLDIVCKAGKSMDGVMRKYEETIVGRMALSTAEKNAVSIVHKYLEPFYKTTNNICTNKLLTIGLVLFFMDHISEMITLCRDSRHSSDWLKNAAEDMATKSRSYTTQVGNIFIFMTAILDPRIKCELIPESLSSGNYLEEARTLFIRNYSNSHFSSMTSGYGAQEIEDGGGVSFAEEIARKKRRVSLSNATDELTQYLSEPPAPIPTDVLEWWKVNSTRYPRLSVMARDFLAVQPTSVAPEDLFCSKGDEIDKQRFCMPHDSTQAILCIRSWMQGGIKLKCKSDEIDYERLMEMAGATTAENTAGLDKKQR